MRKCDAMHGCAIANACLPFLNCCSYKSALNARATKKTIEDVTKLKAVCLDACGAGRPGNRNGPAMYRACIQVCTGTIDKHNGCNASVNCDLIGYIVSTHV